MEAAIDHARALVEGGAHHMLDQFSNPANPQKHFETTGPEIWRDTGGRVTHFVSAMGTTGTIMGVSRYLKSQRADVQIIGLQPEDDARIPGIRRWPVEYLPKIYEPQRVDRLVNCPETAARDTTRRLAREEGLFVGMSGGGAAWASLQLAAEAPAGSVIVFIVPDRGDKYLSMEDLFPR
jgi:cysteine synthase B